MQGLDFSVVLPDYAEILWEGALWTAALTDRRPETLSFACGIAVSRSSWPLRGRLDRAGLSRALPSCGCSCGTPLLLQLFLIYFGLVQIGIDIPAFAAGIVGLGLHFAVYNADVIRAGIVAVDARPDGPRAQHRLQQVAQTFRYVDPPAGCCARWQPRLSGSNMIALLKESSIVSVIGIAELVHAAQYAISDSFRPFEFYITAAAIYYGLNTILEWGLRLVERKVEATR